jgi:N4-gp56 family major capsid protein
MAGQYFDTTSAVYGKHVARTLKKAQIYESLSKMGSQEPMPQNKSQTIEWDRWLPYGGVDNQWLAAGGDAAYVTEHLMQEGVTPEAQSIDRTKLTTTLQNIGCLYGYTDRTRILHEKGDVIPQEMEDHVATRLMICSEMMVYGEMKGCTNRFYGGTGESIATVNGPPTRQMFQDISRTIQRYHGGMPRKMLKSGPNFGSQSINAGWPVYTHTDMEATFEDMPGFTARKDYGNPADVVDETEIGAIGRFRICVNPLLTYMPGQGAIVGNAVAGFVPKADAPGTNIDVYPLIILGQGRGHNEDAFGQVAIRGLDSIMLTHIPTGTKTAADPFGQRGYVGGMTWRAQKILNDAWMAVAFVATRAL